MADHWGVRPPPDGGAASAGVIKLEGDAIAASPPNPFIAKLMASPPLPPPDALESALGEWTPLEIQFVATLSVATFLALLVCSLRCWVRHVQARALADLPPPEKGTVAVSYAWDGTRAAQRTQVPIAGVRTTASLIAAVCDHGAEIVDGEIAPDVVVVFFTDHRGVERRIGARTAFADVRAARLLRVEPSRDERAGLVAAKAGKARGKASKKAAAAAAAAGEDDDISVISAGV